MNHYRYLSFASVAVESLSCQVVFLVVAHLQWSSRIYIATNGSRRGLLLVVSNYLAICVQQLLYDQLLLIAETFCGVAVSFIGSIFLLHSYKSTVPTPFWIFVDWASLQLVCLLRHCSTFGLKMISVINFFNLPCLTYFSSYYPGRASTIDRARYKKFSYATSEYHFYHVRLFLRLPSKHFFSLRSVHIKDSDFSNIISKPSRLYYCQAKPVSPESPNLPLSKLSRTSRQYPILVSEAAECRLITAIVFLGPPSLMLVCRMGRYNSLLKPFTVVASVEPRSGIKSADWSSSDSVPVRNRGK